MKHIGTRLKQAGEMQKGKANTRNIEGAIQEAGSNSLATYLLKPWRPGARGNIFLNQDRESKFKYIEVNKSEIRLEFQDTDSSIYQYYIERWTERSEYGTVKPSMDSISESSDIRDLVIDVRNNTFCGAGATVLLCKQVESA
eukprot:jgi/Bigna1/127538/aug1.4_g2246